MATASNPYDRFCKVLECSICLDVYDDPKTLDCDHEFCRCCLEDILTFQSDGSAIITCPMRCEEKTLFTNKETVGNLGTSYSLKGMLDTLRADDSFSDQKAANKPLCQRERCSKLTSVFCCGSVLCAPCHDEHVASTGSEAEHRERNLIFNAQEGKLRVLCDEHFTGCTHMCCAANQFLCVYCLHRDNRHKNHQKNTIETEAQLLKKALEKRISSVRIVQESIQEATSVINDAKNSLKDTLQERRRQCLREYTDLLDKEVSRLTDRFDGVTKYFIDHFENLDDSVQLLHEDVMRRLDIEVALRKKEILKTIDQQPLMGTYPSFEVSLTDLAFTSEKPLGDFDVVAGINYSGHTIKCNWTVNRNEVHVAQSGTKADDQHACLLSSSNEDVRSKTNNITFGVEKGCASSNSGLQNSTDDPSCTFPAKSTQDESCNQSEAILSVMSNLECSDKPGTGTGLISATELSCNSIEKPVLGSGANASDLVIFKPTQIHNADLPSSTDDALAEDYKLQGNNYFKLKQYEEAIECYSEAIRACDPFNSSKLAVFHQNRGAANEQLNRWSAVVDDCSAAIGLNPRYCKAIIRRARAYEKLDQKRSAFQDWVFVIGINLSQGTQIPPEWYTSHDRILLSLSQDVLKEQLSRLLYDGVPPAYKVKEHFNQFNYDVFTISITTNQCDKNYSEIIRNMKENKYENVLKLCNVEIETMGKHIDRALLLRGTLKILVGDRSCREDLCKILDLPVNKDSLLLHVDAQLKLAQFCFVNDQDMPGFSAAIQLARELDPRNASVYTMEGIGLLEMGKKEEARKCFQTAVSLDSTFIEPRYFLLVDQVENNPSESEIKLMLVRFTQDCPNYYCGWHTYAAFFFRLGFREVGFHGLDKAISSGPLSPAAALEKGRAILTFYNDTESAQELFIVATEIDKWCDEAYWELGVIEIKRKRWDLASKYFEKALPAMRLKNPSNEPLQFVKMHETCKALHKVGWSTVFVDVDHSKKLTEA